MVRAHGGELPRKVSKGQIIDALREAKGVTPSTWSQMKRADRAALAEREIAGTGWLPAPLRAPALRRKHKAQQDRGGSFLGGCRRAGVTLK
jgi:hypothetical protein